MKGVLSTIVLLLILGGFAATIGTDRAWAADPPTDSLSVPVAEPGKVDLNASSAAAGEDPPPPPPGDKYGEGDPTDGMEDLSGLELELLWNELLMRLAFFRTVLP